MPVAPNNLYAVVSDGSLVNRLALEASIGPSDAGRLVALNANGLIDPTMYTIAGSVESINGVTGVFVISGGVGVQVSVTGNISGQEVILISISGAEQGAIQMGTDGGSSAPSTGFKDYVQLDYNALVYGFSVLANATGSCAWDIWYIPGSAPPTAPPVPTSANKISASAGPSITSAQTNAGAASAISTWTQLVLPIWGCVGFNLSSVSGAMTRIKVILWVLKI